MSLGLAWNAEDGRRAYTGDGNQVTHGVILNGLVKCHKAEAMDPQDVEALGRFELPTCGLGNRRSIHLSYRADRRILIALQSLPFCCGRQIRPKPYGARALSGPESVHKQPPNSWLSSLHATHRIRNTCILGA